MKKKLIPTVGESLRRSFDEITLKINEIGLVFNILLEAQYIIEDKKKVFISNLDGGAVFLKIIKKEFDNAYHNFPDIYKIEETGNCDFVKALKKCQSEIDNCVPKLRILQISKTTQQDRIGEGDLFKVLDFVIHLVSGLYEPLEVLQKKILGIAS